MATTVKINLTGLDDLKALQKSLSESLSPSVLTAKALVLAREAGIILLQSATRAVVEAVYDQPTSPNDIMGQFGGNLVDRTNDLINSHHLVEEEGGFVQLVEVDPNFPVSDNAHPGRDMVIDYAMYVHDGYVQYVFGRNTGVFHPGRFWMRVAEIEAVPVIMEYIALAFVETVSKALAL